MGYASPNDMIARFSASTLGDLVIDGGDRATEDELDTNDKLIAALNSAAGQINAACLQGERYTIGDLAGLDGDSLAFLVDLNCAIAWVALWRRKGYTEDNMMRADAASRVDAELTRMRTGEHVFDVLEAKEAGRADVTTVPRNEISNDYRLVADDARGHLYPERRSYRGI